MASSAAIFKPSTDTFGTLTMHVTILGDGVITQEDRKARINALSLLAFIVALIIVIAAGFAVDQAFFAHHDAPSGNYQGFPIDTD